MKAEQLWASILQEAIQGRLVPQLESEPEVKQVGEPPKTSPFVIPKKWKWVQLKEIGKIVGGGTPKTNIYDYWENGNIPWFTPADLGKVKGIYIEKSARNITALGFANSSAVMMPENSVLFSSRAPIGYIALSKVQCCTNQGCKSFVANESHISPMWAYWVLRARTQDIIARASGTTFKEISGRGMADTWIPLPPIEEQMRIVDRILILRSLIESYQQEEQRLATIESSFPEKLRASILQEAIQGKLVPQLESEPPVEQIGKLIDKIPFPIPCKWKWIQLKHATTKITDGTHHSPPSFNKGDFLYITAKNIKSSGVDLANVTYVSKNIHEEIFKRCNPEPGDVLFIKDGATTGVVTINNLENPFSLLSSVALLKVKREILLPEFLIHVLRSQYTRDLVARQMQGTGIPRVTLKKLKELWIPIPPLNEQYRISIKLQNLIATIPCEN